MQEKADVFLKEDLMKSKAYRHRQDLLDALLEDGKAYTIREVQNKIEQFMKGKVE